MAVAATVVSVVNCSIDYNLVDMGAKNLNGMVQQKLLHNQHFPPVLKVGKCQPNSQVPDSVTGTITVSSTSRANLILGVPS